MPDRNKQVQITEFTDPVCTWCWGSEPVLRKLKTRFGDQIKISFTMGGLVEDIREFYDRANDIGGDPERSNQKIIEHWREASKRHGMPVKSDGFRLFTDAHPSSYPQNIAYKAAQMQSETSAHKFLRRMREATAAEARQTNKQEVLIELASEAGLDVAAFIERLKDGSAGEAFMDDLAKTREYGIQGFPSFLLTYGEKEMVFRGYKSYEVLSTVARRLSNGSVEEKEVEKSEEEILQFIEEFESVAPVELQMVFDLSSQELRSVIEFVMRQDNISRVKTGNGYILRAAKKGLLCDPDTGMCS
jgi:predicted DsbA family dithiol-disulfide isomerase